MTELLAAPDVWSDQDKAKQLGHERATLGRTVGDIDAIARGLADAAELLEMAADEGGDDDITQAVGADSARLEKRLHQLEWQRMFHHEADACNAFLIIQAGSGGTEAQDWAEMLLRMYLRWLEMRSFKTQVLEVTAGEVAGIKSACVQVEGDFVFGWLRTEAGVHRLVRKSPFDSGNRRHTSFASVLISPMVDENIEIEINMAEVRVDTYRASGAGGQHVNKTDSAVRLTHLPSNIVAQCQSERSQHQNREKAMNQLRSRLYELEMQKRQQERQRLEGEKVDIGWGNQIRSYVLDQARVKDLRTGLESFDPTAVLDGDLDPFIEASLKAAV